MDERRALKYGYYFGNLGAEGRIISVQIKRT
jgi:hypothetical protein